MKIKNINIFKDWNLFEKVWLGLFTLINIYLFIAWSDTWVGLIASLTGMLCVVLTAKGKVSSFYWGLINIVAYSYVAYQSRYFGDVGLNLLYFLPMTFIGIYYWKKNSEQDTKTVIVHSLSIKQKFVWFTSSIVVMYFLGILLRRIGGTLPFIDSTTTVFQS